jgi:hypothetical protein
VIQRRAYGLRNDDYLRLKILACMPPPLQRTVLTSIVRTPSNCRHVGLRKGQYLQTFSAAKATLPNLID